MLLEQQQRPDATRLNDMTVIQAVLASDNEVARAVQQYQRALSAAAGGITPELEAAIEAMNTHNAWQVDSKAHRILEAVGLTDPNVKVGKLSGGQRRRLALAAALLGSPDLLVLDEPTNHMDVEMIDWMASELQAAQDMAVVMVSHDRAFMERCCERLLELDHAGFTMLHPFGGPGSYDAFKQARAARRHAQANAAADARTVLRKESEWMARQPKARSTKAKARIDAYSELQEKAKDTPEQDLKVDFGRVAMTRLGNKAVILNNVSYTTPDGRTLLRDFSFEFMPGERIGVAGPNGVGKSTLLDLLAGLKQPQTGGRDVGETAVVGYFQQHPPAVEEGLRLIDYIRSVAEKRKARAGESGLVGPPDQPEVLLEKLGFPRKIQFQKVESLSGGERRRLHLAAVLAAAPNVLILDEPTNDLDLSTVEVLEEMLQNYRGLLLVVSHDQALMEACTDNLLVMPGDGTVDRFMGNYSQYLTHLQRLRQQAEAAVKAQQKKAKSNVQQSNGTANGTSGKSSNGKASSSSTVAPTAAASNGSNGSSSKQQAKPSSKRKLGFFEQQEYLQLTKNLEALEEAQQKLNDKLMQQTQNGADLADIQETSMALAALQAQYEQKEEKWYELADIAGDL
eukprot:GHRR01012194.1.p1 GENE.GHRR01012194.1~~GHRR01012194.1.p1  ORF type:complete len:625 (+),score=273.22 GHRR01012194.1:471-2345(+)